MAGPKCLMRDFTNLNRIYKAHWTNVWWIMKVFRVHWKTHNDIIIYVQDIILVIWYVVGTTVINNILKMYDNIPLIKEVIAAQVKHKCTWKVFIMAGGAQSPPIIFKAPNVIRRRPGPWFNIKMSSYHYQYRKSHCGDKTVARSFYPHNMISYTSPWRDLHWSMTWTRPNVSASVTNLNLNLVVNLTSLQQT